MGINAYSADPHVGKEVYFIRKSTSLGKLKICKGTLIGIEHPDIWEDHEIVGKGCNMMIMTKGNSMPNTCVKEIFLERKDAIEVAIKMIKNDLIRIKQEKKARKKKLREIEMQERYIQKNLKDIQG